MTSHTQNKFWGKKTKNILEDIKMHLECNSRHLVRYFPQWLMIQVQLMTINSSQLVINWQKNKNSTMIKNHSFSSLDTKSHFQHPNLKSREIYIFLFLQLQFKERDHHP